ncbi:zinc finger protein 766-like [Adelges cooleyi]|uniref:zinc finger protein 766-like n=1 Tax=Adelges cooleyi TaxID=133065 RepID=UPI0021808C8C|nr:zinc finger protein 766-like [Adelges cooleyi]
MRDAEKEMNNLTGYMMTHFKHQMEHSKYLWPKNYNYDSYDAELNSLHPNSAFEKVTEACTYLSTMSESKLNFNLDIDSTLYINNVVEDTIFINTLVTSFGGLHGSRFLLSELNSSINAAKNPASSLSDWIHSLHDVHYYFLRIVKTIMLRVWWAFLKNLKTMKNYQSAEQLETLLYKQHLNDFVSLLKLHKKDDFMKLLNLNEEEDEEDFRELPYDTLPRSSCKTERKMRKILRLLTKYEKENARFVFEIDEPVILKKQLWIAVYGSTLYVQFKNDEISIIEEYLVKNEGDNTYEVLERYNVLKIKHENDETEEPKPLDVQFIKNEISTTEEYLVKNEVDNTYDIHFPCKATNTSSNTKKINHRNSRTIGSTRNKDGLFNCGVCLKSVSSISSLRRHCRITHTDVKPFKCDVCEKTFSLLHHLKTHERKHTGEKPFKCNVCKKTFGDQSSFKRHERVHTGEKLVRCNVCEKTFGYQTNLKTHERIHTGEKPFKRKVCAKSFSHQANLKRHERIHTGENPINAMSVKKHLVISLPLKDMKGYIPERNLLYAMSVNNRFVANILSKDIKQKHTAHKPRVTIWQF